ncbi:MAG: lipoyl synthase [Myxococcota bacterium]|nr:lipoyl synthase [Myxococcota bacterium]
MAAEQLVKIGLPEKVTKKSGAGDQLVKLGVPEKVAKKGRAARRPEWLRVKVTRTKAFEEVNKLIDGLELNTVCQEARCPNIWECWGEHRTATFMILGEICTRACRYCSVTSARPQTVMPDEPNNVAKAVATMKLNHAVITSVDRDDLPDYGAGHWVETILAIQRDSPDTRIEILTPDFMGDMDQLRRVLDARPDIFSHNVETVPSLYRRMRSKGIYQRCLDILEELHNYRVEHDIAMTTKTGIMVGLGENIDEILEVMDDLRAVHVDVLTVGQYLNPTKKHAPIARFYTPEEFEFLKEEGLARGFKTVVSGPLVRSSYHAHEHVPEALNAK